jgi:hypothetical protein
MHISNVRQVCLDMGRAVTSQDREDAVEESKRIKPYGMHASLHFVRKRGREVQLHQIDGGPVFPFRPAAASSLD